MTELSYYWGGTAVGDATSAPYDDDEFSDIWRQLFQFDRAISAVIGDVDSELLVTTPGANTARVPSGAAVVDGKFYTNSANVDFTIATPGVSTRVDLIVLQKDFVAQTVRAAVHSGVEGAGAPTATQTDGVTWEVVIAQVSITTGGAITIADYRVFIASNLAQFGGIVFAELKETAPALSIPDNVNTLVTFPDATNTVIDKHGFYDSANPDRLTIPPGYGGAYIWNGIISWAADAVGVRQMSIAENGVVGAQVDAREAAADGAVTTIYSRIPVEVVPAGTYYEMYGQQNSGGALDILFRYMWLELLQRG